jgi:hypothetical protein
MGERQLDVLIATWGDGLFVLSGSNVRHELPGRSVRSLTDDRNGGSIAIVDARRVERRASSGEWRVIATMDVDVACCLPAGDRLYVGSDDARIFVVETGRCDALTGFDAVPQRDKWYAGGAVVDGKYLGPPLGVRSMTMTCDGGALLANVHVGGIPRSIDGGATWRPTIDIDLDVHEVHAHPTRPDLVIAAAAAGLCVSRDGGATWTIEREGLHASYCSAVAFAGDDILIAAAADHFATEGAIYRRSVDRPGPLQPIGGGLPRWISGICDTGCIAVRGSTVALADRAGHLYWSHDLGRTWSCEPTGASGPSSVAIC